MFVLSFDSYGLFVCSVEKDVMELREGSLEVSLPLKGTPHKYAASGQQSHTRCRTHHADPLHLFEVVLQAGRGYFHQMSEKQKEEKLG